MGGKKVSRDKNPGKNADEKIQRKQKKSKKIGGFLVLDFSFAIFYLFLTTFGYYFFLEKSLYAFPKKIFGNVFVKIKNFRKGFKFFGKIITSEK